MDRGTLGVVFFFMSIFTGYYSLIALCLSPVLCVAFWKIFTKAGEKGWKSLLPVYNGHVIYQIAWKPVLYWILVAAAAVSGVLMGLWMQYGAAGEQPPGALTVAALSMYFVVFVAVVIWSIILNIKLARSFGKGIGFAAGLFLLPHVFALILAFGKASYQGNVSVPTPQVEAGTE